MYTSGQLSMRRPTDETGDPSVEALRERQIRNFAVILLVSQGVPATLPFDLFPRQEQMIDVDRPVKGAKPGRFVIKQIGAADPLPDGGRVVDGQRGAGLSAVCDSFS